MPPVTPVNTPVAHPLAPNPHTSVGLFWIYTDPVIGRQWTGGTYKVKRSTGAGSTPTTVIASGLTNADYQDTGLTPNTTYGYRIVASDGSGDSGDSPTVYVTTPASDDGMVQFPTSLWTDMLGPQPEASLIPFTWYNSVATSIGQDVISKYPTAMPFRILGTGSINNGSTILTGTGTKFLEQTAANNPTCFNKISVNGIDGGVIASVDSNTQITLITPWAGANQTNGTLSTNVPACGSEDPFSDMLTANQLMYYDSPYALWQIYFRTGDPQYLRGAIKGSEGLFAGYMWLGRNRAWGIGSTTSNPDAMPSPRNFQFTGLLLLGMAGHKGVWDLLDEYLTARYSTWVSNYRGGNHDYKYVREKAYMILYMCQFIMAAPDSFPRSDGTTTSLNGTITVDGSLATGRKGVHRNELNIDIPGMIKEDQKPHGFWYDSGDNNPADADYPYIEGTEISGPAQPFIQGLNADGLGLCWRNTALSTAARNAAKEMVLRACAGMGHLSYNTNIIPNDQTHRIRSIWYFVGGGNRLNPYAFHVGADSFIMNDTPYSNAVCLNRQSIPLMLSCFGWAWEMTGRTWYKEMGEEMANAAFAEIGENTGGTGDGLKSLGNAPNRKDFGQSYRTSGRFFGHRLTSPSATSGPTITMPSNTTLTNGVNQVTLTASASGGTGPYTYRWVMQEYPMVNNPRYMPMPVFTNVDSATTTLCGLESGTYKIKCYVLDANGVQDNGVVTVTVGDGVFPPAVVIGYGNPSAEEQHQYFTTSSSLAGSARAYSLAGRTLTHSFSVKGPKDKAAATLTPSGTTGNVITFTITGLSAGLWIVKDTVTDSAGSSRTAIMYIRHSAEAQPSNAHNTIPEIFAHPNHVIPESSSTTRLFVTPDDPEGIVTYTNPAPGYSTGTAGSGYLVNPLTHSWTQQSGPATATITDGNTIRPTITNLTTSGTYVFRYSGTDSQGDVAIKDITVTKLGSTAPITKGIVFNGTTQRAKVLFPNAAPWNSMGAHKVVFRVRGISQAGRIIQFGTSAGVQKVIANYPGPPARLDWDDYGSESMFMPPTSFLDIVCKIQFDPANDRWTFETWKPDGTGRVERLSSGLSYSTVNYGAQDLWIASNEAGVSLGAFKMDWLYIQAGVDALNVYPGAEPQTGISTLVKYEFENNGNDSSGSGLNLTLFGTPTYEDSPGGAGGSGGSSGSKVTETFTAANGTTLQTKTSDSSHTWSSHANGGGNGVISSNKLTKDSSASPALYYNSSVLNADQYVQATIGRLSAVAGTNVSLVGRIDPAADTYYHVRHNADDGNWTLRKTVGGTATVLGTFADASFGVGNTRLVRFELNGSTLRVTIDGVERFLVTDSAIATGRTGLRMAGAASSTTGYTVDDFEAFNMVTGSAPIAPSNLFVSAPTQNKVVLHWSDNSDTETTFRIERKTGVAGAYAEVGSVATGIITFEDTGVIANTTYFYRIRARNAIGDSSYSIEQAVKTPATGKIGLRVVSFNMQFNTGTDGVHNPSRIANYIAKFNPDLVAGCEAPVEDVTAVKAALEAATGITWYTLHVGKTPGLSEGNLILSRFPILGSTGTYFSNARSVGVVKVAVGGEDIHFFATHLQNGQDATNAAIRQQQINELLPYAATFPVPRIIAGDFNAQPSSVEISTQMAADYIGGWATALSSSVAYAYPDNPAGTNTRTRTIHIDYVFVSETSTHYAVRQAYIPDTRDLLNTNVTNVIGTTDDQGVRPSDHNPVIVDYDITPAGTATFPPLVNAGVDKNLPSVTTSTSLTASASDPDGGAVTVTWTQSIGPSAAVISSPSQLTTNISGLVQGIYVFRCTAIDDEGVSAFDEVTVKINRLPVINAGSDQSLSSSTVSTNLIGIASDVDDDPLTYLWTTISGPNTPSIATATALTTAVSGMIPGVYVFRLTVSDGVDTVTDNVQVTISNNVTPTVDAGADQNLVATTTSSSLTATVNDADGTITSVLWTKISGPSVAITSPSSATTNITGLSVGVYVFRCTVTDNLGATAFDEVRVRINALPVISAGSDQSLAVGTTSTTLTGSATDADANPMTFNWSRVSGPNSPTISTPTALTTNIIGMVPGTYVFRLTVNDGINPNVTDDVQVVIAAAPTQPLAVFAGNDRRLPFKVVATTLSGQATGSGTLVYAWTRVSGPGSPTIVTPAALTTNVTGLAKGTHVFRLTVTNGLGPAVFDEVTVEVPFKRGSTGGGAVVIEGGGTGGTIIAQ